jgi:hypothetical protein
MPGTRGQLKKEGGKGEDESPMVYIAARKPCFYEVYELPSLRFALDIPGLEYLTPFNK